MIYIYALLNGPGQIFYVGQSTNPMKRLKAHKVNYGNNIILKVLQEIEDQEHADKMERAWIWLYGQRYDLVNVQHNRPRKVLPLHVLLDYEIDGASLADGWKRIS